MELRQLEVFRTLAEELHFGRAAQRLYLAQPSVSQHLQRLEAEVGVRLVHRTSRRVALTPAGKVFLAEIERVFTAAERAVESARRAAAGRGGTLRIATNYPASRMLLLPLLERLRSQEPDLTTMLREMGTPEQLRALVRGDLDLGLVYGPVTEPTLHSTHLLDVPVVATVRAGHPLADAGSLAFDRIAHYPYLTGYAGGSTAIEEALLATAARVGARLGRPARTVDLSGYLLELETTDTIGFSSAPRGEQNRANGLRPLRLTPEEPTLAIHVAWNPALDEPGVNSVVAELIHLAQDARDG